MQAFFFQDPDRERLVRIERHVGLLLEQQRMGRVDTLMLLLNPLLIAGLGFILNTVYEGGRNVAVWILGIPIFDLFIIFTFVFGGAFLLGYLRYLVASLKDSITSRIKASGLLLMSGFLWMTWWIRISLMVGNGDSLGGISGWRAAYYTECILLSTYSNWYSTDSRCPSQ
jgi:type IV secretory pathway TrbD component